MWISRWCSAATTASMAPDRAARDQFARRPQGQDGAVDALNTAYAFQLYEMLRQKGLNKGDYEVKSSAAPVRGWRPSPRTRRMRPRSEPAVLDSRREGRPEEPGLRGDDRLAPYQGSGGFVMRSWARRTNDTLVKYTQAYIEGMRWMLNPGQQGRGGGAAVDRLKLAEDVASQAYRSRRPKGFQKEARSTWTVCATCSSCARSSRGRQRRPIPAKYIDLSYYEKAKAGM